MEFLVTYTLPDDIVKFISTGREGSRKHQQAFANDHQLPYPLPIEGLAALFNYSHRRVFFQASYNEISSVKFEGLRDNLQCMIMGAAMLCDIARTMQNHKDFASDRTPELLLRTPEPPERPAALIGNEPRDFYFFFAQKKLPMKLHEWLNETMTAEEKEENERRKNDSTKGKTAQAILEEMFEFPEEKICVRPEAKDVTNTTDQEGYNRRLAL